GLGAWALALSRASGDDDIVFGTVVSDRPTDLPGIEEMIGLFINTLPVRVRVDGDPLVVSWLSTLQDDQVRARQCDAPLQKIWEWTRFSKSPGLFDSIFVLDSFSVSASSLEKLCPDLRPTESMDRERTEYPLTIMFSVRDKRVWVRFDGTRCTESTANRLLSSFIALLEGIVANPAARVSAIRAWPETRSASR
ncbi:MAG: non-ribosomal peptide synthetase, partial [Gammaproteobacteria bacterium]|nr:non-ribosomal peptide synthetase [Gammaproteobacteria bacterium]